MNEQKALRALMGACSVSLWRVQSGQWDEQRALRNIHMCLIAVSEEMDIDLSSITQIERLREEAVALMQNQRGHDR